MRTKRRYSFSWPFLRILLVPSMFLVVSVCLWSLVIVAPFSLTDSRLSTCAGSCSNLLDILPFKPVAVAGTSHTRQQRRSRSMQAGVPGGLVTWISGPADDSPGGSLGTSDHDQSRRPSARILSPPAARNIQTSGDDLEPVQGESHGSNGIGPSEDEVLAGVMDVVEQLRTSGTPISNGQATSDSCERRHVYIYDLPPKFNADLVSHCDTIVPWHSLCDYFSNSGMGKVRYNRALLPPGRWFETLQYALEVIFHARLMDYRCLTSDPTLASLFYVPFYAGLDVMHWNFAINATTQQRDQLSLDLVQWLDMQGWWHRKGGRDHVLVLGKITWDFRRVDNSPSSWGSYLLKFPQMQNLTKLLIERDPWHVNDIGVPHPTYFHPSSDEDIRVWQRFALNSPRHSLVSFAGMPRPDDPSNIRTQLIQQCQNKQNSSICRVLSCRNHLCLKPEATMKLFLNSHFCLQPAGDSPTRRSIFDSLIAGCIPVLFNPYSAYAQYPWHLPRNLSSYSVYISQEGVRKGSVDVVSILQRVPTLEVQQMRRTILQDIMPQLLYAQPGANLSSFHDAFDVSLRNLLNRVAKLEAAARVPKLHVTSRK